MTIHNQKDHYAAIDDVHVNLENRNHAIEDYGYGPLNPKEDSTEFWNEKAELWDTTVEEAKKSRCYNCAAFNTTPKVLKAMGDALGPVGDKIVEKAGLGFCEFFKFKCAGERTCDAWVMNGPLQESTIPEEAPANNAGGGNIAGLGVGPQGEPGLKPKARRSYKKKNEKDVEDREGEIATLIRRAQPVMESKLGVFAGNTTFIVPSEMFHRARVEKRKGKHWKTYVGEDEHGSAIREYANKNRKKAIILQDENTGAMCYARYGGK